MVNFPKFNNTGLNISNIITEIVSDLNRTGSVDNETMADLDMWVNNNKEAIDNSSKIIAKEIKDGVAEIARQIQEGAAHVGAEIEDGLRHVGAEIKEGLIHGALYIGFIMIIVAIILTYVVYPQERDPPKTKNLKAHGRKNLSYIRLESVISDHHSKL